MDTESGPPSYPLRGCYCLLNEIKAWVEGGEGPTAAAQPAFPFASEAELLQVAVAFMTEETSWNQTAYELAKLQAKDEWGVARGSPSGWASCDANATAIGIAVQVAKEAWGLAQAPPVDWSSMAEAVHYEQVG